MVAVHGERPSRLTWMSYVVCRIAAMLAILARHAALAK